MTDEPIDLADLPQPAFDGALAPDELAVDGDNPNEMRDETFGLLCERMEDNGWLGGPVITDTDGLIADGEHRWRAATDIGLSEVPVRQYDIDDATRRLWRQELNKIHGEHDTKRDALEYDHLLGEGYTEEVEALAEAADEDLDELLAEIRIDTSKPADYEYDPDHSVYFEDCVDGMRSRLDDDSVDLVFTSPPYNVGKEASGDRESDAVTYDDDRSQSEFKAFMSDVCAELARVTKPEGDVFINIDHPYSDGDVSLASWIVDVMPMPLRSYIVWQKPTYSKPHMPKKGQYHPDWEPIFHFSPEPTPLEGAPGELRNVWEHPTAVADGDYGEHPAPFPKALPLQAIETAADDGAVVLDPFMGSGTTAVAAIEAGCSCIGFELDEDDAYRPIIERRIGEAKRQADADVNATETGEADD